MVSLDEFCLNTGLWPEWYAIRVFYNRVGPLKETLDNAAIRYFYPMHLVEKCSDGGIIYVQEPLIKALVFAKTTASDLETIQRKHPGSAAPYYDKSTGRPIVIPEEQMDRFIKLCSVKDSGLSTLARMTRGSIKVTRSESPKEYSKASKGTSSGSGTTGG